jgi:hypothetical protein
VGVRDDEEEGSTECECCEEREETELTHSLSI